MMEYNATSRSELLKKIQETDFYAYDLQLYLNTHPKCEKALKLYAKTVDESKKLRAEFESKFGPLTATSTPSTLPWQWSMNPWTWEKERS